MDILDIMRAGMRPMGTNVEKKETRTRSVSDGGLFEVEKIFHFEVVMGTFHEHISLNYAELS